MKKKQEIKQQKITKRGTTTYQEAIRRAGPEPSGNAGRSMKGYRNHREDKF